MNLAIQKDQRQRLRSLRFEQGFDRRILHEGHRLLAEIVAFDLDAVRAELREHRGEADEIRINVGAADAGRAAHGRVIDLDGFHGLDCGCGVGKVTK